MDAEIREFLEGLVHGPCAGVSYRHFVKYCSRKARQILESHSTKDAPDICVCGHPRKQHSFFEDHDECDVCECKDGFVPII